MARKPGKTAQENTANEAKRVRSVSVIDVLGGKGGIPSNLVVEIRSQSKQGVTLAEALSKPLAEVLSAPLPNVDNGDQLLEELLAEGEAAARDAEAEIHKASTPL